MNTSMNIHAWCGQELKALAQVGSHGSCILRLTVGETELSLFLPLEQYASVMKAAVLLDAKAAKHPDTKPFGTYPEDREQLLALCRNVEAGRAEGALESAYRLADLVKAILEDEAVAPQPEVA